MSFRHYTLRFIRSVDRMWITNGISAEGYLNARIIDYVCVTKYLRDGKLRFRLCFLYFRNRSIKRVCRIIFQKSIEQSYPFGDFLSITRTFVFVCSFCLAENIYRSFLLSEHYTFCNSSQKITKPNTYQRIG